MANRGKRKYFLDFQEMKENTGEQLPSAGSYTDSISFISLETLSCQSWILQEVYLIDT